MRSSAGVHCGLVDNRRRHAYPVRIVCIATVDMGPTRLDAFLSSHGLSSAFAADRLGASAADVAAWRSGLRVPGREFRAAIERWTMGRVPASSWSRDDEVDEVLSCASACGMRPLASADEPPTCCDDGELSLGHDDHG